MGYTWLGMQKLTWEEVLQRHEKGELAGCFRLYDDNSEAMIDRGYDFAGDILAHHKKGGEFGEEIDTVDLELADGKIRFDTCNADAIVCDAIIQYALFGTVVFG